MKKNSQSETPEGVPGILPQGPPAVLPGPGEMRLPQPAEQGQDRDWEGSFKGLMSTYNKEKDTWQKERQQLTETLGQVVGRLDALEKRGGQAPTQTPEPQAPPATLPPATQPNTDNSALFDRLAELEAERYRDQLLLQYTEPGAPGQGLPLLTFRDQIRVFVPEIGDDGNIDDAAQRGEIESVIKKLQALRGQTQQAMSAGWTPGSTLEPPRQPTQEDKINRYYEVKGLYGTAPFFELSPAEQEKIEAEYYALQAEVGWELPNQTMPFPSFKQMDDKIQKLLDRMGLVEKRLGT